MANFYPPGFKTKEKVVAIDFDGVIHDAYKGWGDGTCYGDPLPGAIEAIKKLAEAYSIIIFTAKAKPDRPLVNNKTGSMLVREWFIKYGVMDYIKGITSEKPRAELYIDDNGYRFKNWNDTLKFIENEL
jgi:ribonucleotide monophosphatase NagD (HAD superfamily)